MKSTRRDALTFGGGALAGFLFTPVPWKLLDDIAIWTQNQSWVPLPPRGPVEVRHTACTLCSAGCTMRLRVVSGHPVGVAPAASSPADRRGLCPLAYGAHQLPYHPQRLRSARGGGSPLPVPEALNALAAAFRRGPAAIIDGRRDRVLSHRYRRLAASIPGGTYVVVRPAEAAFLDGMARMAGLPAGSLGYDFEHSRTVLSFGAPLLDGFGTPGRMLGLWSGHAAAQDEPEWRLVQAEAGLSRTASVAWRWVPVQPGSLEDLARTLAGLAKEGANDRQVAQAARAIGIDEGELRDLAALLVAQGPAVAVGLGGSPAVAELNFALRAVGSTGGIVARRPLPQPKTAVLAPETPLDAIADHSLNAILIDSTVPAAAIPRELLRRKLTPRGQIFALQAYDAASVADIAIPAPAFLEEWTDAPTPPTAARASYAVAKPLRPAPDGVVTPDEVLRTIAEAAGLPEGAGPSIEDGIRARAEALHAQGRGRVFDPESGEETEIGEIESGEALFEQLCAGAVWIDEGPGAVRPLPLRAPERAAVGFAAPADSWLGGWTPAVLPPLAAKLYQESKLREVPAAGRPIAS